MQNTNAHREAVNKSQAAIKKPWMHQAHEWKIGPRESRPGSSTGTDGASGSVHSGDTLPTMGSLDALKMSYCVPLGDNSTFREACICGHGECPQLFLVFLCICDSSRTWRKHIIKVSLFLYPTQTCLHLLCGNSHSSPPAYKCRQPHDFSCHS